VLAEVANFCLSQTEASGWENHYELGDHFVITMESTLYACTNYQRYLQAFQNAAEANNITINLAFKAYLAAINMNYVKTLINK
jgi:hypothetical protein